MRAVPDLSLPTILPLLRSPSAEDAVRDAEALVEAGAGAVELTTSTDGWARALSDLAARHGSISFALGTVRDADDVRIAAEAGARFLVSPGLVPTARQAADDAGLVLIQGGLTPTEIAQATDGSGWAKVFPSGPLGPAYLRTLRPVLPRVRLLVTGGIVPEEADSWLGAGASAVGFRCDGDEGVRRFLAAVASAARVNR
jgi:2-dehydro-3-deoxyphosphogluconate aldolase / (4S)-4-hydroxy-2-oxoglutarate aldolase